jgi:hypothetical protein
VQRIDERSRLVKASRQSKRALAFYVPYVIVTGFTPLRRVGFQNLWWVLVLEFHERRVKSARRDIAWLDG